jgi:hypothetical protein
MLYITFNDAPSGIYFSQVTDVCNFLNKELGARIRLVAFISIRSFLSNRAQIRKEFAGAVVLPMVPRIRFWRLNLLNLFLVTLFIRPGRILARGPYACWLALKIRSLGLTKSVCLDARGAYAAELTEYHVVEDENMKKEIGPLEKEVLLKSDLRVAISEQLVEYWKKISDYSGQAHLVIPCTLGAYFISQLPSEAKVAQTRKELGFSENDIVIAYSGSSAGWQSFSLINDFLAILLRDNPRIKILFMARHMLPALTIQKTYASRIVQEWVDPSGVNRLLTACDYGLIIREPSVTNSVSSPVKFAEYLSCGLKLLISENIGDYTDFVLKHGCGQIIHRFDQPIQISQPSRAEKESSNALALSRFSKMACKDSFRKLMV